MVHGIPGAEALGEQLVRAVAGVPGAGFVASSLFVGLVGLLAGAVLLALVTGGKRVLRRQP